MIQIKRNNKVFFTLEDFGEGSKLSYQLMDHHYIILKFTTATPVYFEIGDSVEIPDFGYFELTSSYFPKHNDSDGYDYEMQMDAYYMSWKNKICKYRPQHGANETSFNLTTTVGVHMNVILGNLKALGLTYNGKEFSVDYTTYNNKAFDVQKRFLIEYGSISILDALNAICSEDALNCEWWIDGSIIYLGYCEMEGQTTFEQDVNVLSMSYSESKSTYITRLYAFGSDRNIPKGYFTGADADVTTDGVATDYLMLPNKEVDSDGFYAKDGYLENVNVVKNDKQAIEGVVMFEEEYPKVESVVSSIKTYDSTVDNEDGTKTTQTFWQVTSTDSFTNSFKESWIKSNLTLGIKFTSGALMGMEFDVSFKVIDKVNYFEIVANDTYGRTLPDGVMCPKVGDKYFLFNWDATKITDTDLIPTAQLSLFDRAKQYYQKTMISNSNFTCTMDGDKFYNDGIYDYHPLGEQVKLINDMFAQVDADGKHYRNSRIIGMEIPLDIPYDHPQYTVGEKAATSRLGKLEDKVDSIKVNGMQIGGTGSGNGGGVYVIGMNDTTPASDSNVYSARRSRMEFVSRLLDNTAKGTITWEKVQKFFSGLLIGNSNNENGGSWTPDAEGRSHLITDYLEVRMKAIFEELVINKTSTIGGKEIISPAGGVVAHKVEEVTVTYNNVSQKAYRCYFLAEQEGDAVDNDFAIGDQVRSESFNVRKGTYHKVGNHFYWRLVIGRDEDYVELEGKKYHYIDLSDTDCATASDVPEKGDVLSQCGNRTDVERQNCLIFSAVDTYSPSISLYHGINSYSFANKEYVEYGVHKQTNKAFFNVYGDMYVGDRPTKENGYEGSSYVKYDSATKQVTIKGKLSAKSTVDGKELSQYIKENSAGGLTEEQVNNLIKNSKVIADLQNQVDGAIETWFYEGVPTLTNAPASSWTSDKDKDTHLGDLYYDNKTGKAYRFAKDGNTYKWTIIADTDIAKALSDASKAQETADGKMKVFSAQPIPPYQLGDIWVNATYPTDGRIYKNEILRCQTAKAKGSSFAIADWTKASKYTDDSALNTFKEEYKNDMASYKEQLDEKVETWFYNYAPTTQNKPAFDWTTDTLKSQHAGDLFYNTSNGYTYRWTGTAWERIKDNDINTAMTAASKAQDTADGKRTVFTSQPTVPYDEGDLWASGGDDGKTLMVCIKSRTTGSFTSSEWVKANDSDLNAFAKTIEESLTGIQDQLDKKAETWYQSTDPSTSWTTDDAKKKHKGDLWYNTSNNQTFFWNGTKWDKQDVPTEVFDKIDGKSSIYVSKPASYEERDLWILEAAYTLGGVAYSKGELVVATKTNASFSAADWTKKVKYTDDTVANAAKAAAEKAQKAAETAQTNVTNLGKTVTSNKMAFDSYVTDGYLEPSEIAAMAQDSKRLEDAFAAAEKSYNEVKGAEVLKSTKELTNLNTAFATLTTAKTELVTYLSDISSRYNAADTNGKATIVSAVGTKFTNFQSAYSAFYDKLGLANAYITSKIYGDLKQNITDLAGYKYIKDALGQTTDIDGGLVMTTLLALRDADGNVQSGINGAIDTNRGKKSIATWWGGQMVDKDYNSGSLTPATSLVRFDGSGYLANGAIWWDVDGKVHADPTSFIISEKNLGAYLAFFEPTWKSGSNGTNIKDLVALTPQAPFTTLSVSNDLLVEGKLKIGSITLSVVNGALKIDGNVYSTGGMSAYGEGTSNGGGLNGSIVPFDKAKFLTAQNEGTEIASAWSIKKLYDMINSIDVTGQLADYLKKTEASTLYQPKGNYLTSHQDISGKSDKTHTHSVKINGVTKTIAATGGTAVDLGTYLTSHQSLAAYLKSADAEKTYSKLGHTHAFSEITGKPTTLAGYGVTDGVNTVTLSGSGNAVTSASIDGHTLTLTKGSTFSLSGHTHTFASLTSKPSTIAGYGITDAYTKAQVDSTVAKYLPLAGGTITGALTVNGIATFKSKVAIGDIYIINDGSGNLYVQKTDGKTAANFYATGGITAFGASSVSGGTGGGLNGSVLGFEKATAMTSANNGDSTKTEVSFLASAWSIKQLNDKIAAFGTGVFSDYLTIAAAKATYQPKGSYLTSHQTIYGLTIQKNGTSLGTYTPNSAAKTINVTVPTKLSELSNDSGYTKNTGTVTSVAISVPTGLSVSGSPITTHGTIAIALASGYSIPTTAKQTAWDGAVSAKHTHSNKSVLDGITSAKVTHWDNAYDWYALMTTDEETADGIINKWNEVVSFLANIAQTDTLSGIVDGINKSISDEVTRAKKAEGANASGISTNKTNITTLQGYFTSGSAKKALQLTYARKLWGNSFNGTADINGSIIVPSGKYISIGNIKMEYDATNKALKITNTTTNEVANLYTSGGVSAYGVGTSQSSGGGLNGSVKAYADSIKLTTENLSEIASAYSIAVLNNSLNAAIGRISTLEGGSATSIETTGSGNAVTSVSKSGTKITFTKGSTFSLNGHTHDFITVGANQTITATQYTNSRLSVRPYYSSGGPTTYGNILEVVSGISGGGQLGMEWSGSQTKTDGTDTNVGKLYYRSKRDNMAGWTVWKRLAFAEELAWGNISGKPTSLSGYGITDGVNAVSVTGSGNAVTAASVSGHTLTLTKGSSFSLSNHTHYIGTTQVQGSSAEQALTGITKIDNILKLSKASVTVNTSYKAEQNRLVIYGSTYGNDANYIKSAGKLSYGDGGPQLVFSTGENPDASDVQSAALVYTDHDTIGAGVSLSFVTNQSDAYFIAPHIKALTAFQGNLAWSYITNKPTTLSGFGITDGLRSVTQPSGSNVFVTGISTSGTAVTYTKSYTKKSLSAVGTSGWTNASTDGNIIPDMSFIAYWNGAYSGTSSNLAYCNKGAFGSFAIKNSLAFSELTSKPTTISGYGITDAYTKSQVDAIAAKYLPLTGGTLTGQLKIVASALNGAYNGLLIGDDCYIGDCNLSNTIGLMGVSNNNAGMVKFGKGGMQFGYNGSNHIASTTAQWTNLNADLLDGWHKDNIVWSGAVNSNTASLSHYWAKLFDITVTGNQYDDRSFTFLFSNGYNDTYSVVVLRIRQNGAKDSGAYNFNISLRELVGNMSSRLRVYYNNATGNVQLWGNCQGQYGSLSYTIIKKTGRTSADFTSQGTLVTNTSFSAAQSLPATTGDSPYTLLDGATRIGIVKQADQLVTARSLWGQSFNGTANVSGNLTGVGDINTSAAPAGTIYTNNWFRSKGSTGWYSEDHGGGWYMSDNTWIRNFGNKDVYLSNKLSVNGNVGIGTTAPSHKLHVSGEIYTTTKVNINGIVLEKDSDGNLKVNGNLYATGGISAYGASDGTSSGGGLNGSVKSYADALKLTSESLSEIASAYSIKQLSIRITSLEGGSATSISVSGGGNAVTSVTKNGTTISVVKGSTFLTAHQSLAGYMKTATADAKYMYHSRNNIVSDLNSFATNGAAHIYEMNNVTNRPNSNSWVQVMNWGTGDSDYGFLLANDYSTNGHMYFRQKIAGSWKDWKTIIDSSNIGSQSVNYAASAGSVAWTNVSGRPSTMKNPSALSWSGYSSGSYDGSAAKSISIPNNTNQLTNGAGFITSSASITGNAGSATKLQTTRTLWGQSFNGTANISGSMTGVGDMTLDAGARIKHGSGNLYIGNSDNSNWIGVQDICSQSSIGDGNWSLRTSGAAHFKDTTINGTATINNLLSLVDGSHKGLKMGSTYISSLNGEVILQGNTALRFGNDAWDYNQWAGLKYDHSSKTVYLGIADGSIFKANSAQSGGVINLKQGISSVYTPALYAVGDIYHTGVYRMLWKNSKASKYLNVMSISQDDKGILTIGYGNFSNNKTVVLEGYNLNFRVGNDSGTKSMWLEYNNGNPVLSLDGNFYATGGVTAYKSSDERLKHDIHGVDSLAIIKAMGGTVAFRYNADNKDSIGWIAQRVLHNTFMQDLVEKDDKGFLKINYWSPKLIAVAFGAIEQVGDEVSRLKARVVFLESEVQRLSGKQGSSDKKRLDNKNINLLN